MPSPAQFRGGVFPGKGLPTALTNGSRKSVCSLEEALNRSLQTVECAQAGAKRAAVREAAEKQKTRGPKRSSTSGGLD